MMKAYYFKKRRRPRYRLCANPMETIMNFLMDNGDLYVQLEDVEKLYRIFSITRYLVEFAVITEERLKAFAELLDQFTDRTKVNIDELVDNTNKWLSSVRHLEAVSLSDH